jgi:hypothetical protein
VTRFAVALLLVSLGATDDPLLEKARRFRTALVERHLSPEGLVLYRVDLDSLETDLERGTYPDLADTPTFTGLLAATACTRARVEGAAGAREARSDADRALSGLELLTRVTGTRGLLARGARRIDAPAADEGHKKWFAGGPGFERYRWRGDVSVDQYANGLLPAAAECRGLFPDRVRRLVVDFAEHLLEHDLRIVDPDGRRTRFGDLTPGSGYGLNSIARLTAYATFALAAELDPDPRWDETRDRLRDRDRVVARSRTTNVRIFGITNHSNDLMAWNLYRVLVPLARRTDDPALGDLRHGMWRTWLRVRPDGNPYFVAVHCTVDPGACDRNAFADGRETLRRFPLEKRKVAHDPALDRVPRAILPGRKFRRRARHPVPIELRPPSSFEWKSSPYRVSGGVAPTVEYTGLDYLAAYWLYRDAELQLDRADSVSRETRRTPISRR